MRRLFGLFLLSLLLLFLAKAAKAQDVDYNFDYGTNFSKYKTYKWVEIKNPERVDADTVKEIKAALDAQLAKKGLSKREVDPVDLYVGYELALTAQTQYHTYEDSYEPGAQWDDGWAGRRASKEKSPSTKIIYTGELALDMYDTVHKMIVWRSVASKTIDPNASPEQRRTNIAKAAERLLKPYPPKNP
jgi:hypothetical protein